MICDDFGYDIVNIIAEWNGSAVIKGARVIVFGNEDDKGSIEGITPPTILTTFLIKLKETMSKKLKKC